MCARINLIKVSTYGETRKINCTSKMHENASGRVAILVNLVFCRLGKFDGSIFRERGGKRYIYRGLCLGCQLGYIFRGGVYIQGTC